MAYFDILQEDCLPDKTNISTAKIAFVGEAPGADEMKERKYFVGLAGNKLVQLCERASVKIPLFEVYKTNCIKTQLPKNDAKVVLTSKGYRHPDWSKLQKRLIDELAEFDGNMIVLLGDTAMRLLLDDPRIDSITKYRGSVYKAEDFLHLSPLKGKLIAITNHPASTLYTGNALNFSIIERDLAKFKHISENSDILNEQPVLYINPTFDKIESFLKSCISPEFIAFDIEINGKYITTFSLAKWVGTDRKVSSIEAMSIPIINNRGNVWPLAQERMIWMLLAKVLDTAHIVAQNGMFDLSWMLRTMDIHTAHFTHDTMLAHHLLFPDYRKNLGFITSWYTHFPYYKDEGGKQAHYQMQKDWDKYWRYNAKDAAYLLHIREEQYKLLKQEGLIDYFYDYTMALHAPLLEMEINGLKVNEEKLDLARATMEEKIKKEQIELDALVGYPINIASSQQMQQYFYGFLNIKPYMNRKTGKMRCDAVALARIGKLKGVSGKTAQLVLSLRKDKKMLSTYFNVKYDKDGYLRCQHNIAGTKTGRLSTSETLFGTGTNLQNQPPVMKQFLYPADDEYFIEFDLAQAEAHVVAYLCQDMGMIRIFQDPDGDIHTHNAASIFKIPVNEVTKDQRQMGKKLRHAKNYRMGPQTFSDNLAAQGIYITTSVCKKMLNAADAAAPLLLRWQEDTEAQILRTGIVYNLFGRPKKFPTLMGRTISKGTMNMKEVGTGIAYVPQSSVAELLNRGLIKIAYDKNLRKEFNITLRATVHDSILMGFPKTWKRDKLYSLILKVGEKLHHEFTVHGRCFIIGYDVKIGSPWGSMIEMKKVNKSELNRVIDLIEGEKV